MTRTNLSAVAARTLTAAAALTAIGGNALAEVNVRGGARIEASHPVGTNDFHIVYDSTLGPFNVTGAAARDNRDEGWAAATGAGPAGSSPTTRETTFTRTGTANFSWLDVSIQITGERLCSLRVLDKWWTINGVRQNQRVGGFGMLQDTDPATGNTRVWVLNDHTDMTLRVSNISLDIFSTAMLPDVASDLGLSQSYAYTLPDAVLAPGSGVSFTFPRSMVPDEWSTVQGRAERWEPGTGTWEPDGNFRYQHEYLPVPTPGSLALLGLGTLVARRRRFTGAPNPTTPAQRPS